MMSEVPRRRGRRFSLARLLTFVLTVRGSRTPGEVERQQGHESDEKQAAHVR